MFVAAYGAEAGNLALRTVATAGVYVGGGIAPKILPALEGGAFLDAFRARSRWRISSRRFRSPSSSTPKPVSSAPRSTPTPPRSTASDDSAEYEATDFRTKQRSQRSRRERTRKGASRGDAPPPAAAVRGTARPEHKPDPTTAALVFQNESLLSDGGAIAPPRVRVKSAANAPFRLLRWLRCFVSRIRSLRLLRLRPVSTVQSPTPYNPRFRSQEVEVPRLVSLWSVCVLVFFCSALFVSSGVRPADRIDQGKVTDTSGAVLPGVTVEARSDRPARPARRRSPPATAPISCRRCRRATTR